MTFASHEEPEHAINDHIINAIDAVEEGELIDNPDPRILRVVEIEP